MTLRLKVSCIVLIAQFSCSSELKVDGQPSRVDCSALESGQALTPRQEDECGNLISANKTESTIVIRDRSTDDIISKLPKGVSAATKVTIGISDKAIKAYKYKIGNLDHINCSSISGYSDALPSSEESHDDITALQDGKIAACVLIEVAGKGWLPPEQAIQHIWTKNTADFTLSLQELSAISPSILSIQGNNFAHDMKAQLNGNAVLSEFQSSSEILVKIPKNIAAGKSIVRLEKASHSKTIDVNIISTKVEPKPDPDSKPSDTTSNPNNSNNNQNTSTTPVAAIYNAPAGVNNIVDLDITISGKDITHYRYQLGASSTVDCSKSTDYKPETAVEAKIKDNLFGTPDGEIKLCVIGKNSAGLYQSFTSATSVTWTKDPHALTAIISGAPTGSSNTTILDITVSGVGLAEYYYQIGETANVECDKSSKYKPAVAITTKITDNISIYADGTIKLCVIGKTAEGKSQEIANATTATWTKDTALPTILLSGEPSGISFLTDLNVTLSGTGITDYKYKVGPSASTVCSVTAGYSSEVAITNKITDSILAHPEGTMRLCVIGVDSAGNWQLESAASEATWTKSITPPEPNSLNISAVSDTQATLTWASGGGSTSDYRISYQTGATAPASCSVGTLISETSVSGTSHAVTGLTSNSLYSFRVCAVNTSNPTAYASSGITTSGSTLYSPPNEPASLNANADSDSQITLNWSSGGGTTTGFRIAYQTGNYPANCSSGTVINEGSITGTSHAVSSLSSGTSYYFRVCAINGNAIPDVSSGVTVTEQTLYPLPPNATNLTVTSVSTTAINLSWDAAGGSTSGYKIAYITGTTPPGDCDTGTVTTTTTTSRSFSSLTTDQDYSFRVCSYNSNGTPDYASGITISQKTNEAAPPNPSMNAYTSIASPIYDQMRLSWTSNAGTTAGYRISYLQGGTAPGDCSSGTVIDENSITGTTHTVTGLDPETEYSFRVCAINSDTPAAVSNGITKSSSTTFRRSGEGLIDLSFGDSHGCALSNTGKSYCWGGFNNSLGSDMTGYSYKTTLIPMDMTNINSVAASDRFIDINAGDNQNCGITSMGLLYCWGEGYLGDNTTTGKFQATAVDTQNLGVGERFIGITNGYYHSCAISNIGKLYCWGGGSDGALGDGTNTTRLIPTEVDTSILSTGESFIEVDAGYYITCGVTNIGKGYCWGNNDYGQLGIGTSDTDQLTPQAIDMSGFDTNERFLSIDTSIRPGGATVCATTNKSSYCWGSDNNGRIGDGPEAQGSDGEEHTPKAIVTTQLNPEERFRYVGGTHNSYSYGITHTGIGYSWGLSSSGVLGRYPNGNMEIPDPIDRLSLGSGEVFTQMDGDNNTICSLTSLNRMYCWGSGTSGKRADGTTISAQYLPKQAVTSMLSDAESYISIALGYVHACATTSLGKTHCWGYDGTNAMQNRPEAVNMANLADYESFKKLALGQTHSCGLTHDGDIHCWGQNDHGKLGYDANGPARSIPDIIDTSVLTGSQSFIDLDSGITHLCAIASSGKTYCWGRDNSGQLGDNPASSDKGIPTEVSYANLATGEEFVQLALGTDHSCARSNIGNTFCWGENSSGQLGNNTTTDSGIPIAVDTSMLQTAETFIDIQAGGNNTCARSNIGTTYCWGDGFRWQIGDGSQTDRTIPTQVNISMLATNERFRSITVGIQSICGVTSSGVPYCWGRNTYGQLGDNGTNADKNMPTAVDMTKLGNGETFRQMAIGEVFSCGITTLGKLYCWGRNDYGQLGDNGTTTETKITTAVDSTNLYGPSFISILGANEASDHHINDSEKNSTNPLGALTAFDYVSAEYTSVLDNSTAVLCDSSQTYASSTMPLINEVPAADGFYIVCVKLTDSSGVIEYGKSYQIEKDIN